MNIGKRRNFTNLEASRKAKTGTCSYLAEEFIEHIDKRRVKVIFECGSRDCLDAIRLSAYYAAYVVAFECNPDSIKLCEETLAKTGTDKVVLIKKAVLKEDKKIKFYPVDLSRSADPNVGASSCFLLNFPERKRPEERRQICVQNEITVDAIRIDTFCRISGIQGVDMLCIDLQGAEIQAFEGCGALLQSVSYVITEIFWEPLYYGQHALFQDIVRYLSSRGFCLKAVKAEHAGVFGNALFVNKKAL